MRKFVMGDIHGAHRALLQCLERASFDYANDLLIQLGDVSDGFDEVYECVEELLKIRNLIAIKGNHDEWLNQFCKTGYHEQHWSQGGKGTVSSYSKFSGKKPNFIASKFFGFTANIEPSDIPETHKTFFRDQVLYLKHNLNAEAIGALKVEATSIQADISKLIEEMNASINQADTFIRTLE